MVNLLPASTQWKLRLSYYLRLATSVFAVGAFAVGIGAGFLFPSYLLARDEAEIAERYIRTTQETVDVRDKSGASATVALLNERVNILGEYKENPVTGALLAVLSAGVSSNVRLQKISVRYSEPGKGNIVLSGVAGTRSALLAYVQTLQKETVFTGVTLPVSQLTSDKDIQFSLPFSFSLTP